MVVSPLISLIEDQLVSLELHGVEACTLNSATGKEETNRIMNAMLDPNASLRLLYVTPEKLAKSKRFMAKLEKMHKAGRFARLVIDEVHCCSQWGHDFRPGEMTKNQVKTALLCLCIIFFFLTDVSTMVWVFFIFKSVRDTVWVTEFRRKWIG